MKSKINLHNKYILTGFAIGFFFSLAGITLEDYRHGLSFMQSFIQIPHYIAPVFLGIIGALFSRHYYRNKQINKEIENGLIEANNKVTKHEEMLQTKNREFEKINDDLVRMNETLKKALERAEESDKLKTAFLNNMSHEIRTPLNAIAGFSKLMTKPDLSREKTEHFSELISSSSDKLIEIITDVIEIAQIHARQIKANLNEMDVHLLVNSLEKKYNSKARAKNLIFEHQNNLQGNELIINSDIEKLIKIFTHLLENSLKYTSSGYIKMKTGILDNCLVVTIEDSGIGIPHELQKVIFEPFRQAERGINGKPGGNGLGLAIVKAYTELLNGSISLISEVNQGTSISVSIPLIRKEKAPADSYTGKIENSSGTILIAEDEYSGYELISELFADTQIILLYAENGQEAIDLCRANSSIDLILMDIKMPVMDGYTAAKMIKTFRPSLPIIAQTAFALQRDKERYIGVFDEYITKPIDENELFQKMNKYGMIRIAH